MELLLPTFTRHPVQSLQNMEIKLTWTQIFFYLKQEPLREISLTDH